MVCHRECVVAPAERPKPARHPRDDLLAEIATLRSRVDELEAENSFLRDQLAVSDAEYEAARLLGIPHWLVPAMHLFVVRQVVSKEALTAVGDDLEWTTAYKFPRCPL